MEIGGYIEFPEFLGTILHGDAIALNSARNCLVYLIEAKGIKKIVIPKFLCQSVEDICKKKHLSIRYYAIGLDFRPHNLKIQDDEWLYLVNYYGQIDNKELQSISKQFPNIIVDNVQAYFQSPIKNVDTIYTCRKFFGVSDGAFLCSNASLSRKLEQDKSAARMLHLLGRYEDSGDKYYTFYKQNEKKIETLPLREMSAITKNLLRSIDYKRIKYVREENYSYLNEKFSSINKLKLRVPEGPFAYPLYIENGDQIRKKLIEQSIYIPMLWENVLNICDELDVEYRLARDILPLPCDQRYNLSHMQWITNMIFEILQGRKN